MLKFGLLIILLNIFLKLVLGIGLWKMAMDSKMNYSAEYHEEPIEGGNPDILRGQNAERMGRGITGEQKEGNH